MIKYDVIIYIKRLSFTINTSYILTFYNHNILTTYITSYNLFLSLVLNLIHRSSVMKIPGRPVQNLTGPLVELDQTDPDCGQPVDRSGPVIMRDLA